MRTKAYILTFFMLLSGMVFGQVSNKADFSFKVKFEKAIPVEKIEIFYPEKIGHQFNIINYKINIPDNEIEIFGTNSFFVEQQQRLLPTIVFSYKEKKLYKYFYDLVEREAKNLFYLISESNTFPNKEDVLDKEIKFSKDKKNIIINPKDNITWNVSNKSSNYEMSISNELTKVNPIVE